MYASTPCEVRRATCSVFFIHVGHGFAEEECRSPFPFCVLIFSFFFLSCLSTQAQLFWGVTVQAMMVLSAVAFCVLIASEPVECRHESFEYWAPSCRKHSVSITDFGGVGDGVTVNTEPFRNAVAHLAKFSRDGGGQLYVPPGRWLTGPFNLTSAFTLYLHRDAVILASQVRRSPSFCPSPESPAGPTPVSCPENISRLALSYWTKMALCSPKRTKG